MMRDLVQIVAAVLMLAGAGFSVTAAIGILRLPDLYTRLHAASKAGPVGAGLILIAVALASFDGPVALRAILGVLFLLLGAPVSAHLLAKAALRAGEGPDPITNINDLR